MYCQPVDHIEGGEVTWSGGGGLILEGGVVSDLVLGVGDLILV